MDLDGISNESRTSSIWLVRVPSKPISHDNGCHMHFIELNTLRFQLLKKNYILSQRQHIVISVVIFVTIQLLEQ